MATASSSTSAWNYQPLEQGNQSFSSNSAPIARVYADKDSFGHTLGFLTTFELCTVRQVSELWKSFIDGSRGQVLWKNLSIREGVPLVKGDSRNYKDDFKFLRPITISSRTIAQYLGKVVGDVPRMSEGRFIQLKYSQDSFEHARPKNETHVVLVDPAYLKITVSPDRPLTLDDSGTLVEVPDPVRAGIVPAELIVPFSLKNLRALAKYPLAGIGNGPVFYPHSADEVFERCNAASIRNSVFIMRREIVEANRPFDGNQGQNAKVTNRGWNVMTVRRRAFYDAINILQSGTCPDNQALLRTYALSGELVNLNGFTSNAIIGGFAPGIGVDVTTHAELDFANLNVGVVPGGPAEVSSS